MNVTASIPTATYFHTQVTEFWANTVMLGKDRIKYRYL